MQWLGRKKSFFSNLYRNTPKEGLTKFQIYVETKKLGLLIFIQAYCYGCPGGGKKTQKRLSIWILSKSNTRHSSIQGSQLPGWLIGNCIAFLKYYDIRTEASWTPGLSSLGIWVRITYFHSSYLSPGVRLQQIVGYSEASGPRGWVPTGTACTSLSPMSEQLILWGRVRFTRPSCGVTLHVTCMYSLGQKGWGRGCFSDPPWTNHTEIFLAWQGILWLNVKVDGMQVSKCGK